MSAPESTDAMERRQLEEVDLRDGSGGACGLLRSVRRFLHGKYAKTKLWITPVGREMRTLAIMLEREAFPTLEDDCPSVVIAVGPEALEMGALGGPPGGTRRIAAFLHGMGVGRLKLDRLLEWNQIYDVLAELWCFRRRLTPDAPRRRPCHVADALASEDGLNIACTQVRFSRESGELVVGYSYCRTALSRAVRGFKTLGRFEADHRRFFFSAQKFAAAALLVGLVPVAMVIVNMSAAAVVLTASALSLGSATLVYLFFLTVGSIEYDNEIAQKRLELTLQRLRERDEQNEADLGRAKLVQESLLPGDRLTEFTGRVEAAYDLLPQRQVGGDFLDLRWMSEDRVAIIIADVVGHGLPAALVGASLATSFWHQLSVAGRAPVEKVARLNGEMFEFTPGDHFVTLIYAELDLAANSLRYCCAGHPPAFVVGRSGKIRDETQVCGPPIGAVDNAEYEERELSLGPGDTLVLYTDGITEAHNPDGELFDEERLRSAIDALPPDQPAKDLVAGLRRVILEFQGDRDQYDDQALLAIRLNHD